MRLNKSQTLLANRFLHIAKSAGIFLFIFLLIGCQPVTTSGTTETVVSTTDKNLVLTPSEPVSLLPSSTPVSPATRLPQTSTTQPIALSPLATSILVSNPTATVSPPAVNIKTIFIIVMENHNWSDILNSPSAPYINQTLLPQASYAMQYYNPPGNHPSEPNYLWLEAGTNFGIKNDSAPQENHQSSTDHLVTYLLKAGISWKAYQEGISGDTCPLKNDGLYAPKHNPMVYFDDVTNQNDPNSAYCIAHERPFGELQADLQNNTVAQYNFITPDLCHDMHNAVGCDTLDEIKNGDTWLSEQVPIILASSAYKNGGVLFITWDESEDGDNPIGMIVLSPFAKGGGYTNSIPYTHSSTLRTAQEILNVTPLLGDAAQATDLSDLFRVFP
jgi:hypothetical protein